MDELQKERGLTYMFITHDLSVVHYFSDEIAVMYLGSLVEKASAEELFARPLHPYTQALLSSIPNLDIDAKTERNVLAGEVVSPINLPNECRFTKRCPYATSHCRDHVPELKEVLPNHFVACDMERQ
jgi:peptide/nickel transport system ATP-binding protein